jgi:head-tail adaptor
MRYDRFDDYARLNPGNLRDRVTFYSRRVTKSALTGSDEISYTTPALSNVSAKMNPTGGGRFYDAARFTDERLETCTLRWQAGINVTMQLEFDGRRYEILRVDDVDERRVKLMLALRRLT